MAELNDLIRRYWLWGAVAVVAIVAFLSAPGDYGATATAILHGLCAQTPSHTLHFGDRPLPFDARMTGIYGGLFVTIATLAGRGTLLRHGDPPPNIIAFLGVLVGAMAIDGTNSLMTDLGVWHPYMPTNAMRIATGYGAGVALGVALGWLLASSLWRMSSPDVAVGKLVDLRIPAVGLGVYGALLILRPEWLHLPVSLLLVASAWLTVSLLMLVIVLLVSRLDAGVRRFEQLHVPVAVAALLAISVMLALAGARFWVERTLGITNAMF